jgi:hypothetical protein
MERQRHERDSGVSLVLLGEGGAVALEAWTDPDGDPHGVLVLHQKAEAGDSRPSGACDYIPGSRCLSSQPFISGHELAPAVLAGYDDRAWAELYQWFTSRLGGGKEQA